MNQLEIAGKLFSSRLIAGSSRYPSEEVMLDALKASGTELVTVSIRRININQTNGYKPLTSLLLENGFQILPNTAGCYTAKDAVLTAQLAREALGTAWVKLEVIGDEETLFPDVIELL